MEWISGGNGSEVIQSTGSHALLKTGYFGYGPSTLFKLITFTKY
jgi:hypothetical protein